MTVQRQSNLSAFIQCRCPRCHQGKMFVYPVYRISKFNLMNKSCMNCGLRFEIEPGFYWGAMYVSYALNILIAIITGIISFYILGSKNIWIPITVIVASIIVMMPIVFRYSRVALSYIFTPAKEETEYFMEETKNADIHLN